MSKLAMLLGFVTLSVVLPVQSAEAATRLSCRVSHYYDCSTQACRMQPWEFAHIDLLLDLPEGGGNLCTPTYCRPVTWLALDGGSKATSFGALVSAASGSQPEELDTPVADYLLWIADDRKRFSLVHISSGTSSFGACSAVARKD